MRVHNLMLDLVTQKVEEYNQGLSVESRLGEADQLDMICYVLNRVSPLYVVSGRGMAHTENQDYTERTQKMADITKLISQAHQVIEKNRRERTEQKPENDLSGPWYNFPNIIGRLLDGQTFSPIRGALVYLYHNGEIMKVMDPNWQNPYNMVPNTAGTYLFWPHPLRAEQPNKHRAFGLEIRVELEGYESLRYGFTLELVSENQFIDFASISCSHRLKDLYLFPAD